MIKKLVIEHFRISDELFYIQIGIPIDSDMELEDDASEEKKQEKQRKSKKRSIEE
jgi:hypothetical protein